MPETPLARFSIGQLVYHMRFDYRGVVCDVDPTFSGTEEWYEQVAGSRPPKDKPWYHVLVHGGEHATYVAERHLTPDPSEDPIDHPALELFFNGFEQGRYIRQQPVN